MDKKKKHLEVRSVPKTYRVTQEMNQEIRAAANWFGCTDTMIIDIALLNFLSLSIEGRTRILPDSFPVRKSVYIIEHIISVNRGKYR
ncbi:MAG TPA: hypothetical protein PK572_09495 [Kiritimatiellia bacterium]|nr:MAG: hypothetical protein BWY09_01286 [Candidatus Hydrogenedentes bacterium ADurb.Bin179]HQM23845.1 hypothetical protein [Kiritimatiellia bacterium]